MKTVRFSQVVKKAGKPSVHLQLVAKGRDRALKKAELEHRVLTVNQATVGHSADYGEVGLDSKLKGQVLIFPRSLAKFAGKRVVGIKYEMLDEPAIPKAALAPKAQAKERVAAAVGAKAKAGDKTGEKESDAAKAFRAAMEKSEVEATTDRVSASASASASRKTSKSVKKPKTTRRGKTVAAARKTKRGDKASSSGGSATAMERKTQAGIKRAIQALESGQSVKAYNVLKGLVGEG